MPSDAESTKIPVGSRCLWAEFAAGPPVDDAAYQIADVRTLIIQADYQSSSAREHAFDLNDYWVDTKYAYWDLNKTVGLSSDGKFDVSAGAYGFYKTVLEKNWKVRMANGWTLVVYNPLGPNSEEIIAELDLNLFLTATYNGLDWQYIPENIRESGMGFYLERSGPVNTPTGVFKGTLLGRDGTFREQSIDLLANLMVTDGEITNQAFDFNRGAFDTWCLNGSYDLDSEDPTGLTLTAKVWNGSTNPNVAGSQGEYVSASIDLSTLFKNSDGGTDPAELGAGSGFAIKEAPGLLDADGAMTLFLETVPYVCWFVTVAHIGFGKMDAAKRAAATSVYTMAVFACGATGGILGGIPGAMIGSALGTNIGLAAQDIITAASGSGFAPDAFDPGRYLSETVVNVAGAGISGGSAKAISKAVKVGATPILTRLTSKLEVMAGVMVVGKVTEEGVDKISGPFVT
ncbi:hypothetical protein ABW20_dc0110081 [Dactylellina cionopaga]|nr:hypothetical protein ABW20_dc0110081 [Dactylellina cionopaga]